MTTATTMTCSLTSGWTSASSEVTDYTSGSYTRGVIGYDYGTNYWPNWWDHQHHYYHYTPWITPVTVTRDVKVVLKFSEVDRLRKAAQKDEKLKAVLEKLTPCIEVVVDLDDK